MLTLLFFRSLRIPFQIFRMRTIETLEKTDLEWTQFQNGYFLDYYGMPYVESNLKPLTFVLDVANKAASIPGTGNEQMTFTYTKDLAKFVVAALDLPKWTYPMVCYSDKTTWNKAVKLAEGYRGMFGVILNRFKLRMQGPNSTSPTIHSRSFVVERSRNCHLMRQPIHSFLNLHSMASNPNLDCTLHTECLVFQRKDL